MIQLPQRSPRTDTRLPDTTLVRSLSDGVRIARLTQEVPPALAGTVYDVVAQGLGELGDWLATFHRLSHAPEGQVDVDAMAHVQTLIEAHDGWSVDSRVEQVIQRLDLPEDADRSAEHTSELKSLMRISYAVLGLK